MSVLGILILDNINLYKYVKYVTELLWKDEFNFLNLSYQFYLAFSNGKRYIALLRVKML